MTTGNISQWETMTVWSNFSVIFSLRTKSALTKGYLELPVTLMGDELVKLLSENLAPYSYCLCCRVSREFSMLCLFHLHFLQHLWLNYSNKEIAWEFSRLISFSSKWHLVWVFLLFSYSLLSPLFPQSSRVQIAIKYSKHTMCWKLHLRLCLI